MKETRRPSRSSTPRDRWDSSSATRCAWRRIPYRPARPSATFGPIATRSDALNNEAVAAEVVATLVGSIGMIAAVPVTTAIAALLATRSGLSSQLAPHAHAH